MLFVCCFGIEILKKWKMKLDEELGRDREDEFQTDDEENQAERACEHESDSESDSTCPSHYSNNSTDAHIPTWPQSYRCLTNVFFF